MDCDRKGESVMVRPGAGNPDTPNFLLTRERRTPCSCPGGLGAKDDKVHMHLCKCNSTVAGTVKLGRPGAASRSEVTDVKDVAMCAD